MARNGKRRTIERGIYQEGPDGPFEVKIVVGGTTYRDYRPFGTDLKELRRLRAALELQGQTETPAVKRGTLAADAVRYVNLVKHLASWEDRRKHLKHWSDRLGDVPRHNVTHQDVLAARVAWLNPKRTPKPFAPKTINHLVGTLRHLYKTLDGRKAKTPCDEVTPLPVAKTPITRVSNEDILKIDAKLQAMEARRTVPPWNAKTRARFRVLVSTGKRPSEIMRAVREDIDLDARVWVPRDAKGGFCPGVYLNDDMWAAWKLFIDEDAFGDYSIGQFAATIRKAGWPAGVRPYQARHNTWITASERGVDLADISIGAGHTDIRTTRRVYVPVLNSRLEAMSKTLDGRFKGWPVGPDRGTEK